MGFLGEDIDPKTLLDEFKKLLEAPSTSAPNDAPQQSSSGGWQSPIHGTWHNLGGFDPSMVRYDDKPGQKGRGHFGVDMGAAAGTPVYSMGPGTVSTVGTDKMGGNIVGVNHPDGTWTYYAHLSTAKVHVGDRVDTNTVLGTVGNTGNPGNPSDPFKTQEGGRTWPHLHFGVKEKGSWVDPSKFFNIPAYDRAYAANPGKFQKFWLSDQAKQESETFNMKEHNKKRRLAFTHKTDQLLKLASQYCKLAEKP